MLRQGLAKCNTSAPRQSGKNDRLMFLHRNWQLAWFLSSAAKYMKSALCCVIAQRVVVMSCWRFAQPIGPIFNKALLKMGPIGCADTSLRNCHYSLRNNTEGRASHLAALLKPSTFVQKVSNVTCDSAPRSFIVFPLPAAEAFQASWFLPSHTLCRHVTPQPASFQPACTYACFIQPYTKEPTHLTYTKMSK